MSAAQRDQYALCLGVADQGDIGAQCFAKWTAERVRVVVKTRVCRSGCGQKLFTLVGKVAV